MRTSEENGIANDAIVRSAWIQAPHETFKLWKSDGAVHYSVLEAAVSCKNHDERIWPGPSE